MNYPVMRTPGSLSPSLPPAMQQMAAELIAMRADIQALKRGARSTQLASSSVESGAITFNDAEGNPQIILGVQPDGTHALAQVGSGDPGAPSDPVVTPGLNGISVAWDGTMADGSLPLSDFAYVQAEADAIFPPPLQGQPAPLPSSAVAQLTAAGSVSLTGLIPNTPYAVFLTAYSQAGTAGDPSNVVTATTSSVVSALISAQAIIAGIVNGTTITGAQFVAFGGNGEILCYSGPPAAGNLVVSVSTNDSTDAVGNAYLHGVITYSMSAGTAIAQGWQDGGPVFATANTQAGPYAVASGKLRSIGSYQNGYTTGQDINGNPYPVVVTQLDLHSITLAGSIVTPNTWVSGLVFGSLGAPFLLPQPGSSPPEFPCVNANGGGTGRVILRPNGNMQITSNVLGTNFTLQIAGTFRF